MVVDITDFRLLLATRLSVGYAIYRSRFIMFRDELAGNAFLPVKYIIQEEKNFLFTVILSHNLLVRNVSTKALQPCIFL